MTDELLPSQVGAGTGVFDRFADLVAGTVARASFFGGCVILVLVWAPSLLLIRDLDTWQLIINTATTIITFLLVALLQNTQKRADGAVQQKLNALAGAQLAMLDVLGLRDHPAMRELEAAIGVERHQSAS